MSNKSETAKNWKQCLDAATAQLAKVRKETAIASQKLNMLRPYLPVTRSQKPALSKPSQKGKGKGNNKSKSKKGKKKKKGA